MAANSDWNHSLDPMAVMRLSSAYWHSSVIHVAQRLDLFNQLAVLGKADAPRLAQQIKADPRGVELIAIACIGLGLLEKEGDFFKNSLLAQTFLVESSPRYQGGIVAMFDAWVQPWSRLGDAVAAGQPVVEKQHDRGEQQTRKYIMGMLYRGIPQAHLLAQEVPLSGRKRLLDVGGGPGIFTIIFCQKNQGLHGVVMDLPQTLTITREIIQNHQAQNQVSTLEGNYLTDQFGQGYDVVLLSSMINQEGPDVVKNILQKSYAALNPGGLLVLQEQLLNAEKTGPLLAALIGLNQVVHTPAGRAYSAPEIAEMARKVGFKSVNYRDLPEPSPFTLITAVKS